MENGTMPEPLYNHETINIFRNSRIPLLYDIKIAYKGKKVGIH